MENILGIDIAKAKSARRTTAKFQPTAMFKAIYRILRREQLSKCTGEGVADFIFFFATAVLFLLFSNLFLTAVTFLFGGGLSLAVLGASAALTVVFVFVLSRRWSVLILASIAMLFYGSIAVNRKIYDISYDGQTYHQEAVIQLSHGWNPVYQDLDPEKVGEEQKWINYYPKSSWINESYIYLLTNEQRTAKALNLVLIAVSMALIYVALRDSGWLDTFDTTVLAVLLAFNPVSIYQSLTFYVDGQLMSLFLCICSLLVVIHSAKRPLAFFPLLLVLTLFINIKFTALVYGFFLIVGFIAAEWIQGNRSLFWKTFGVGAGALAIGVFLIGFSPYLTNTIRYGAPFYPLYGADSIDIKPDNVPGNFIDKNSLEILFLSFFSDSGGARGVGTTSTYESPLSYTSDELDAFRSPDPVTGGFGPVFGAAVAGGLLALVAYWLVSALRQDEENRARSRVAMLLVLAVVALSAINPIASNARYVPQAYLVVLPPIVLLLSARKTFPRLIGYLMIVLLAVNSALIAQSYVSFNLQTSAAISTELAALALRSRKSPVLVYFNQYKSTRVMLQEAGVNYVSTTDRASCPTFSRLLPENTTEFCVDGAASTHSKPWK